MSPWRQFQHKKSAHFSHRRGTKAPFGVVVSWIIVRDSWVQTEMGGLGRHRTLKMVVSPPWCPWNPTLSNAVPVFYYGLIPVTIISKVKGVNRGRLKSCTRKRFAKISVPNIEFVFLNNKPQAFNLNYLKYLLNLISL